MYASSPGICTEVTNVEFRRRLELALTVGGPDPSNGTRTIMTISLEVAEKSPRRIKNYRTSPETARPNRGRRICERAFGTVQSEGTANPKEPPVSNSTHLPPIGTAMKKLNAGVRVQRTACDR
jgi:hypothetical protein